jgi:hypothetical protein
MTDNNTNDLWVGALRNAHYENLHQDDPSGYWNRSGCPLCEEDRLSRIAYLAKIEADAAATRRRREQRAEAQVQRNIATIRATPFRYATRELAEQAGGVRE